MTYIEYPVVDRFLHSTNSQFVKQEKKKKPSAAAAAPAAAALQAGPESPSTLQPRPQKQSKADKVLVLKGKWGIV
jgi:hypothetical protein